MLPGVPVLVEMRPPAVPEAIGAALKRLVPTTKSAKL
jgi:hypothetical protein